MKKSLFVLVFSCFSVFVSSCSQDYVNVGGSDDAGINVQIDVHKYIKKDVDAGINIQIDVEEAELGNHNDEFVDDDVHEIAHPEVEAEYYSAETNAETEVDEPECYNDVDCEDDNPCTDDQCDEGGECIYVEIKDCCLTNQDCYPLDAVCLANGNLKNDLGCINNQCQVETLTCEFGCQAGECKNGKVEPDCQDNLLCTESGYITHCQDNVHKVYKCPHGCYDDMTSAYCTSHVPCDENMECENWNDFVDYECNEQGQCVDQYLQLKENKVVFLVENCSEAFIYLGASESKNYLEEGEVIEFSFNDLCSEGSLLPSITIDCLDEDSWGSVMLSHSYEYWYYDKKMTLSVIPGILCQDVPTLF